MKTQTVKLASDQILAPKFPPKTENFLNDPQNDLKTLNILIVFCRWTGVTPFSLKANSFGRIATKFIFVIFVVVFLYYEWFNYKLQLKYDGQELRTNGVVYLSLKTLWFVSHALVMMIIMAKVNFAQPKQWRRFFARLRDVETIMTEFDFRATRNFFLTFAETFAYIFATIVIHICHFTLLAYIKKGHKYFAYITPTVSHIHTAFTMTFFHCVAKLLGRRYDHLIYTLVSTPVDRLDLAKILRAYRKLYFLLEGLNSVFGLQVLFCVTATFTVVLIYLTYSILDPQKTDMSVVVLAVIFGLMYLSILVMSIMACESVERSAEKIVSTAYSVHETADDYELREQLLLLIKYMRQWKPVFSAAGFFNVNQKTLPAFLSAIIQYLVIVIQFSMATSETQRFQKWTQSLKVSNHT